VIPEEKESAWRKHSARLPKKAAEPQGDERRNAFERHADKLTRESKVPQAGTELEIDCQNAFTRNDRVRAARKAFASAQPVEDYAARREADRRKWVEHDGSPRTSTGTLLDAQTQKLKSASDADRIARRSPVQTAAPPLAESWRTVQALIEFWDVHADNAVNFFRSEFNYTSLVNCLLTLIFAKGRPPLVETVAEAFELCVAGNHLETMRITDANGATIRKRGEPVPTPPTLYPAYVFPAQADAANRAEMERQIATWLQEKKAAEKLSFADLQRRARANYKPAPPQMAAERR